MDFLQPEQLTIFIRLALAALLGGLLGIEREYIGRSAGTRTYALVSLGAALFSVMSIYGFENSRGATSYDPSRIAANIVVGIGFLGAGIIVHYGEKVRGLTTAAGLWVAAAVGMTAGLGFYKVAVFSAVLAFVILAVLRFFNIERKSKKEDGE